VTMKFTYIQTRLLRLKFSLGGIGVPGGGGEGSTIDDPSWHTKPTSSAGTAESVEQKKVEAPGLSFSSPSATPLS